MSMNSQRRVKKMFSKGKSLIVIALAVLLAGLTQPAIAQTIDGNLTGTVVDATGATVPNASIEVTNSATGIKNTTKTGTDGLYRLNNLPVGRYDISVTATGFAVSGLKNVPVELNKTSTANVTMQVQGVTQQVAVTESPTVIDTTTSQLQSTFQAEQIVNLPIIESAG